MTKHKNTWNTPKTRDTQDIQENSGKLWKFVFVSSIFAGSLSSARVIQVYRESSEIQIWSNKVDFFRINSSI